MSTPAQAAVLRQAGGVPRIEPVTLEAPRDDELLIEIRGVGICHTDMVMRDGHLPVPRPVVLGHEGSGVVRVVGAAVRHLAVGDHVVLSFSHCGHCPSCGHGQPAYCHSWAPLNFLAQRPDGTTAITDAAGAPVHSHVFGQSSFATHAVVPAHCAIKVDKALPIERLGPFGCGLQTGAGTVLNVLRVRPGSSVAIVGVGAVGLAAVMAAVIAGASTIAALDLLPERIDLARQLGATHGAIASSASCLAHAAAFGCPAGFDYVIDTTGHPGVVEDCIAALAPRGEVALVGAYPPGGVTFDAIHVMSGGRAIRGVVEGGADPAEFIPLLLRHYEAGRFPFDRLVRTYPFAEIAQAIEDGEKGRVVKPVLLMGDG